MFNTNPNMFNTNPSYLWSISFRVTFLAVEKIDAFRVWGKRVWRARFWFWVYVGQERDFEWERRGKRGERFVLSVRERDKEKRERKKMRYEEWLFSSIHYAWAHSTQVDIINMKVKCFCVIFVIKMCFSATVLNQPFKMPIISKT